MKKEFLFSTDDGAFSLRTVCWLPDDQPPRAVMQIVHGIYEYMDRYDDFATFLSQYGIIVVGCDLPGHGHTAKGRFELGQFAEENGWRAVSSALNELAESFKKACPNVPFYLFGHSMGSFLVRTMLIQYPNLSEGAILSGTGHPPDRLLGFGRLIIRLAVRFLGPNARSKYIQRLVMGSYNRQFAPNRTSADWLSRDEEMVDRFCADSLTSFLPTVSLFRDLTDGLSYIRNPDKLTTMKKNLPLYFFSGEQDPVGENGSGIHRAVQSLEQVGCHNIQVKLYPEGRHEMLNEINRQEVFGDVLTWLNKQIKTYYGV
jgi:alpha-beta hydrolase superfamily lysophospholipase